MNNSGKYRREVCSSGKSPLQLPGSLFQRKKSPATAWKSVPAEKGQIRLSGSLFQQKKGKYDCPEVCSNGKRAKHIGFILIPMERV
jgi:hypothetical protein